MSVLKKKVVKTMSFTNKFFLKKLNFKTIIFLKIGASRIKTNKAFEF
jgi:hypothetical protein